MNYFVDCNSVEETKVLYKTLAKKYHPDLGGDLETMQIINLQYEQKLRNFEGKDNSKGYSYKYDPVESVLMTVITKIYNISIDLEVDLIGLWIWVSGNTKPYKDDLKQFLKWSNKRKMWYYAGCRSGKSNKSIDELGKKYGRTRVGYNQLVA
jgi:hypothetical protein